MKELLLLPNRFKKVGWVLLLLSVLLWIAVLLIPDLMLNVKVYSLYADNIFGQGKWFGKVQANLLDTTNGILCIVGGLLVGFSKEKVEDEYIASMRLKSLMWSVLVSYILLLISFVLVYGLTFLNVLVFQMFSVLLLFVFRFNYMLRQSRKGGELNEE